MTAFARFTPTFSMLCLFAGCGGEVIAPVEGKVSVKGGPIPVGAVVLLDNAAKQITASGPVKPDGTFKVTYKNPEDGAPPGTYQVAISSPLAADSSQQQPPPPYHSRYLSASTSGLQYEVKPGKNTFNIELDPP